MDIKIIVAAHKECEIPKDSVYLPLFVGSKGKPNIIGKRGGANETFARDDSGENISEKNPTFCELTGIYWAWKNLDAEYIGLVHYRRIFGNGSHNNPMALAMSLAEYQKALEKGGLLIPRKRNYYIESLYSHYSNTHSEEHLKLTREIIKNMHPDQVEIFDKALDSTKGAMFNMFVMSKSLLDDYCNWLFPILFELEKKISTDNLTNYNARLFGRISELLFNVWLLEKEKAGIKITEIPWYSTTKVPWIKKITSFLKAKFTNKKYEGSF